MMSQYPTEEPVYETEDDGPDDEAHVPVHGVKDLALEQADAQEHEDDAVARGA